MKQAGTGLIQVKINNRPGEFVFYSLSLTLNYLYTELSKFTFSKGKWECLFAMWNLLAKISR